MRLLVSWLRDFVDIDAPAEEIAERVSLRGFEVTSIESLDGPGGTDAVIDFQVTANRPDCLSVVGLAREVATIYDLPLAGLASFPASGGAKVRLASVMIDASDQLAVTNRGFGAVPPVCGGCGGRNRQRLATLDGGPPAGGRHQACQLDRRSHQLRPHRARPSYARVRFGEARRPGDPRAPRRSGRNHRDARRRPSERSTLRCSSSPIASARTRSPA